MRLELVDLQAGYGETTVLRDVTLTVPRGRVVALLGPNGAGKTTTLATASGLLRPQRGRVILDDVDVTGLPPHRMAAMGVCHVTEADAIYPGLTVADNIRMFAARGREDDAVQRSVTAFPRLAGRLRQIAGTLSGGEQRMLALSRVYGRRPSVILLDEISLGLAPIVVDEIFDFLGLLAADGASLLVVEQYVEKALALADLVYMMGRGRIVFAGEPHEISGGDLAARYLGDTRAKRR